MSRCTKRSFTPIATGGREESQSRTAREKEGKISSSDELESNEANCWWKFCEEPKATGIVFAIFEIERWRAGKEREEVWEMKGGWEPFGANAFVISWLWQRSLSIHTTMRRY